MNNAAGTNWNNGTPAGPMGFLTLQSLQQQNRRFADTGGVSQGNRSSGFLPAFADDATGVIYLSRFADGRPAPMHLLEGLPAEVVIDRADCGRVKAVKETVVAGFVRDDRFYTREQAAAAVTKH